MLTERKPPASRKREAGGFLCIDYFARSDYSQLKSYSYFRVDSGEYRIVYRFDTDTVYTVLIGKRKGDEVYDKLIELSF